MKRAVIETYKFSKTFNAPLGFVFDWCTDFREDDGKMVGSETRVEFVERNSERLIWIARYKSDGQAKEGIRVVWLKRPDEWRLETCGDGNEKGRYKLTSLGKERTRLDMAFDVTYNNAKAVQSQEEFEIDTRGTWDSFAKYLEKDYKASVRS